MITEDVSMRMPSLVGQFAPSLLERAAKQKALPGVLVEARFYNERKLTSGRIVRISGQMDHVLVEADAAGNELSDYKFPGIGSLHRKLKYGIEEWVKQVNLYALILRENEIPVDRARIIATGLGWMWSAANRDPSYPQSQTIALPVDLWPATETEAFLQQRLDVHTAAEGIDDELLPACTDGERWIKATRYAVMKPGRKSAVRVVDTHVEAEMIMNGNADWSIVTRLGQSRRCLRYCAAGRAGLCSQWNAERAALEAAGTPITVAEEEPALS